LQGAVPENLSCPVCVDVSIFPFVVIVPKS
jgi:hypothetical protein